jgi:CPA2 family monovalent cation:H+ antiporter-2
MTHLPQIITDLGLILAVGGVTTLLFKKIKQPVVLGYILAGFLVGPHFSLFPDIADKEGIQTWSEIGVIFLLFSLGLEFSFKKLVKVGGSASITAIVEVVLVIAIGFVTGQAMGWNYMDSIFLGAILSMSSTTIIIRAFEEVGARTQKFASLVFGILIVEDLVAILLMVLLSTVAASQQFGGSELLEQIAKLAFFLTIWFLAGIFFIPTFLKRTRKLMNDETLLIVSVGLCLLMVMFAVNVGFSAALGAFIMGSILAETTLAEHIEHLIKSVKDLFAAIFFVSVGMMIDPQVLVDYAVPVMIVTFITIFAKFFASTFGALISGQPLKHSIQAGMSLAQIGEFSFIIASLGLSLKVTSGFLYPIAVAASAVTTLTTPFMIKHSEAFYEFLERTLPERWIKSINRYSSGTQQLSSYNDWKELLKAYISNTVIQSVIIVGIILLAKNFLYPFISEAISNVLTAKIVTVTITLILLLLPIWALAFRRIQREAYSHLWLNRRLNRGPLIAIEFMRIVIAIFHVGFLLEQYFPATVALITGFSVIALAIFIFSQKLQVFYDRIENRFLLNLNEREKSKTRSEMAPWDAHLTEFEIQAESSFLGKPLKKLAFREKYGVNIVVIERGSKTIVVPSRHELLYPGDKISVIGTDDQLEVFKKVVEQKVILQDDNREDITLQSYTITKDFKMLNMTIRESEIREQFHALIVGIERNNERYLNPESSERFLLGDTVWVVGSKSMIKEFFKSNKVKAKEV